MQNTLTAPLQTESLVYQLWESPSPKIFNCMPHMHTQILVCRLEECQWSYWSRLQSTPLDNQGESRFWTIFLVFQIELEISQTIAEVCHFNPTIKFQVFWVVWANLLLTLLQNFIVVRGLLHAFQIFPTVIMICRNVATIITFPVLL